MPWKAATPCESQSWSVYIFSEFVRDMYRKSGGIAADMMET